jgi:hypothetical protein
MSPLRLNGSTSGYVELAAAAVAGNVSLTLPSTAGNVVVNGANSAIVSGTAQNSTSGTNIDFTGIPSWVKRVTVMFNGVSTNGTSNVVIRLGTGSTPTYTASGYLGIVGATNFNTGFQLDDIANAAGVRHGAGQILLLNPSTFIYSFAGSGGRSDSALAQYAAGGSISLGAVVTAVRITTVNGTDTFDAGSINILYE